MTTIVEEQSDNSHACDTMLYLNGGEYRRQPSQFYMVDKQRSGHGDKAMQNLTVSNTKKHSAELLVKKQGSQDCIVFATRNYFNRSQANESKSTNEENNDRS